ncbi:MAG: hypothetical protein J7J32_06600 [Candidatus Atribacteria bacterium]|nr:hypothetical protein [Candidatus Atribacteria bacterium]MCD6350325.1 hypothetical protein [Candidatus Atribacteria bacterium]
MIPVETAHRLRSKKDIFSSDAQLWYGGRKKTSGAKFWVALAIFWGIWFFLGYVVYPLLFSNYVPLRYLSQIF